MSPEDKIRRFAKQHGLTREELEKLLGILEQARAEEREGAHQEAGDRGMTC
jgi:transcriptional regulator with XRE-family HTH domain